MGHLQGIGKGTPKHFTAFSYLALFLDHHPDWFFYDSSGASLMLQTVKKLLAMQETLIQSLCQKEPLEKGMATLFSSCLGNPRDRGAWRAAVRGIANSWMRRSDQHFLWVEELQEGI